MLINCRGKLLNLDKPVVMGIINATPDSFFSKSRCIDSDSIRTTAMKMIDEGASILDVGGFSTRPGAANVSAETEAERLRMAIEAIRGADKEVIISVDTFRSNIAAECISLGADIINDVSGGLIDDGMFDTIARLRVPYILTHTQNASVESASRVGDYANVCKDVITFFSERISKLKSLGANDIIIDPGFGFAKSLEQNYELLTNMSALSSFGYPVLAGISRKRMVWQVTGGCADDSLDGTTAMNMIALSNGARILRVHDVAAAADAVKIFNKSQENKSL